MKAGWPAFLRIGIGLLAGFACTVTARAQQRQRQPPQQPIPSGEIVSTGTIYVRVRSAIGGPLRSEPSVVLTTGQVDGPVTGLPTQMSQDEWEFTNLQVGADYEIRVDADGYQPEQKFAHLPPFDQTTIRVDFWMQPSDSPNAAPPPGHFLLAPAAQREVQQATHDLQKNKLDSARKHLGKALVLAPGNPGVNYLMGLSLLRANRVAEATSYFQQAISIDPSQVAALLALGTIRYRQGDFAGAVQILTEAVAAAPDSWQAEWMLASACLGARQGEQARLHAERALKLGKKKAVRVNLLLGDALERLGENAKAQAAFEEFLKEDSHDAEAAAARREVAKLKLLPAKSAPVDEAAPSLPASAAQPAETTSHATSPPSASVKSAFLPGDISSLAPPEPKSGASLSPLLVPLPPPVDLPPPVNWAPPDVDAVHPSLVSGAACPLPAILKRAGRSAITLVENLQEFSATEDYQSVEIGHGVKVGEPLERKFRYMAFIHHVRPELFSVEELRQPSLHAAHIDGQWVGIGSPALALAFHPLFRKDFDWQCEGLGEWRGQPAWLVHFSQSPSQPVSLLHVFVAGSEQYPIPLKGLAWVGEKNGQVLHLETDMVKPQPRLELAREHFAIDYKLVRFRSHPVSLWLPEDVNLYIAYRHRYYHSYSRFTDFQLFWVGAGQEIGKPKQTQDHR